MNSKKGEMIFALVLIGMGLWINIDSYRMGIQSLRNPGPGLLPFVLGNILCVLGVFTLISSVKGVRNPLKAKESERNDYSPDVKVIGSIVGFLIGYAVLIDKLGFLTTSYLVMLGLFWMGNPRRSVVIFVVPALVVAMAYIIFGIVLRVHFPAGLIERLIYGYFG